MSDLVGVFFDEDIIQSEIQDDPTPNYYGSLEQYIRAIAGTGTPSALSAPITLVAALNQTVFLLPLIPASPDKTLLFVNNLKYSFGSDYMINGAALTWRSPVRLDSSDRIEFYS